MDGHGMAWHGSGYGGKAYAGKAEPLRPLTRPL